MNFFLYPKQSVHKSVSCHATMRSQLLVSCLIVSALLFHLIFESLSQFLVTIDRDIQSETETESHMCCKYKAPYCSVLFLSLLM
ncbi:hypothetical protein BJX70DRAFT_372941 [Aspergillus crustosus]